MVIKYLRRKGIIRFTAISVKLFLSSIALSIIWMNQFTFRCKKNIFVLLIGLKIINYGESWKEKKTQAVTYYTVVSWNMHCFLSNILVPHTKTTFWATQNFSLVFVLMNISVRFNVFGIRNWLVTKNKNTSNKRYLGQHKYAWVKYAFKFVYASRFP
jgi:hypothetical protein